eukprot:5050274-Prymnesium_polylepis.1
MPSHPFRPNTPRWPTPPAYPTATVSARARACAPALPKCRTPNAGTGTTRTRRTSGTPTST